MKWQIVSISGNTDYRDRCAGLADVHARNMELQMERAVLLSERCFSGCKKFRFAATPDIVTLEDFNPPSLCRHLQPRRAWNLCESPIAIVFVEAIATCETARGFVILHEQVGLASLSVIEPKTIPSSGFRQPEGCCGRRNPTVMV